jgi:metal-responsive CopG/Arc/MetJ family transcriptional regulator
MFHFKIYNYENSYFNFGLGYCFGIILHDIKIQTIMMKNVKKELSDGIYLVQTDGSKVPFTGRNSDQERKGCKYIGLKLGSKAICIALRDAAKEYTPLTSGEDTTKGYGNYIDNYLDATADWAGMQNTEHLKQIGLSENIHLEEEEYIPSAGELKFIQLFRKQVQEALDFVGGKRFPDVWYWTSTEQSRSNAWCLYLNAGDLDYWNDKATGSFHVRAVSAF